MNDSVKSSTSFSEFYEENLYRLQNGVLNIVNSLSVPFYLTGGTALSRGYYHHRYSDDLDFFVNRCESFGTHVNSVLKALKANGFFWNNEAGFVKTVDFSSVILQHPDYDSKLKIDFVNDVAAHFGGFAKTPIYDKTDSIRNILSNKVTAVFRMAAKDIVDICEICLHENFEWKEIFTEVREKELGVEPAEVSEILRGLPQTAFDSVRWIRLKNYDLFMRNIEIIAKDMLCQSQNSLFGKSL